MKNCDSQLSVHVNGHLLINLLTRKKERGGGVLIPSSRMKIHTESREKNSGPAVSPARTTLMVIRSIDSIGPQRVTSSFSDFLSPLSPSLFFLKANTQNRSSRGPLTSKGEGLTTCCFTGGGTAALCNWINSSEPEINLSDFLNFSLFFFRFSFPLSPLDEN